MDWSPPQGQTRRAGKTAMPRGPAATVQGLSGAQEDKPGGMEEQGREEGLGPEAVPGAGRVGGFLRTKPRYASKGVSGDSSCPSEVSLEGEDP